MVPEGRCISGACVTGSCTLAVASGSGCPGQTVDLTLTGTCQPQQTCPGDTMVFSMTKSVQYLTSTLPGSIPCDGTPYKRTVTVGIDPGAPPWPIVFEILGTTPVAECSTLTTVTVQGVSATLSLNPSSIAAKTTWPDMPDNINQSDIAVTWNPPQCVGTLAIVELEPQQAGGYLPPNQGTLDPINDTRWGYTAFDEPPNVMCPAMVKVRIAAMWDGQELPGSRRSVLV